MSKVETIRVGFVWAAAAGSHLTFPAGVAESDSFGFSHSRGEGLGRRKHEGGCVRGKGHLGRVFSPGLQGAVGARSRSNWY